MESDDEGEHFLSFSGQKSFDMQPLGRSFSHAGTCSIWLSSLDISPYMVQRVKNTKENQKGLAASVFVLCLPQRKRVESADGKGSVDETEANKAHSHEQVVGSFFWNARRFAWIVK